MELFKPWQLFGVFFSIYFFWLHHDWMFTVIPDSILLCGLTLLCC